MKPRLKKHRTLQAVDLFSGAGGVTAGYKQAGISVVAAVEIDSQACATYRANHPEVTVFEKDIRRVPARRIADQLRGRTLDILTACSPCGSYSTLRRGRGSARDKDLALVALRFVRVLKPRVVVLENVPQLQRDERFRLLKSELRKLGYRTWWRVIDAQDYGVPQRRKRLIIVASRETRPTELTVARLRRTVKDAFRGLDPRGRLNRPPQLSDRVLERIRAIGRNGGSRDDLPEELQLACHKKLKSGATNVYGRMSANQPAPTLTTRCTTPACGRFIHPSRNRPITLREAACLQTFPRRYSFVGNRQEVERQIGNAVPVELARRIAVHAQRSLLMRIGRGAGQAGVRT